MTIFLAGDSTCAFNDKETYPQVGWGQFLTKFMKNYTVANYAKNGQSTKSFINEGRLENINNNIKAGDILLIQFGHNDQKKNIEKGTDPFGSYQENLKQFINVAKNNSAMPILLTSVSRRQFDKKGKLEEHIHLDFPESMKKVAETENIYYIDMYEMSREWLINLGSEKSKEYFMWLEPGAYNNYPDGIKDNTHFVKKGALVISEMIANKLTVIIE